MSDSQYDVSPAQRRILEEKAKRRFELRQEYWKNVTDPHRFASGEGGAVFDPAMQRFHAMRATGYEYFKHTPKTSSMFLATIVPMGLFIWFIKSRRDKREHLYRTGQVAYKDRSLKFSQ